MVKTAVRKNIFILGQDARTEIIEELVTMLGHQVISDGVITNADVILFIAPLSGARIAQEEIETIRGKPLVGVVIGTSQLPPQVANITYCQPNLHSLREVLD